MSNSVVSALQSALEASPQDLELRLHLAGVLSDSGSSSEALVHYQAVLADDPCRVAALEGAAKAAAASGLQDLEAKYQKILSALGQAPQSTIPESNNQDAVPAEEPSESIARPAPKLRVVGGTEAGNIEPEEIPALTLADVGGLESVKRRINISFLAPMRDPLLRQQYGLSLRGGLLLYGPPGCGKTFLARALAGELKAKFYSVGLNDVLDMWFGESERKLHELFENARRKAPAVLFFDEIDALGHKRGNLRGGAGRNLVNALLSELDGVNSDNDGLFVLGATNHPWDVDEALRRPGRFDRSVLVLPPDVPARESILRHHLQSLPAEKIDAAKLASQTPEFSGADLKHLCKSAAETAVEESLETGRVRPLSMNDFTRSLSEIRPSTRPWFVTAKNYAMFANEGEQYDELLEYITKNKY